MNLSKIGVVLLALLLAGMAVVPCVSAVENENDVDQATAQHIAEMHMQSVATMSGDYKEWVTGTLQPSTVYYDLNDHKTAYLFDVSVDGLYSGYILTSATRNNYPILEFSRGKVPDAGPETLSRAQQAVQSSVDTKTQNVGSPRLLYLGGTFYFAQYPVTDSEGSTIETKFVDLSDNSIVDLQDLAKKYPLDREEQKTVKLRESRRQIRCGTLMIILPLRQYRACPKRMDQNTSREFHSTVSL